MNYINHLKRFKTYYEDKKDTSRKVVSPFKLLGPSFVRELVEYLSNLELIKGPTGKINTTKTVTIANDEMKAAVGICYECNRSDLLVTAAKEQPEYASLTPLVMYAQKKYNKVPYEQWDKTDENLIWALGKLLGAHVDPRLHVFEYSRVKAYLDNNTEKYNKLRNEFLNGKPADGYYAKKVIFDYEDNIVQMNGNNLMAKMLFQTWVANSSLRVPGAMILDADDWDKVPSALDLGETITEGSDLPW